MHKIIVKNTARTWRESRGNKNAAHSTVQYSSGAIGGKRRALARHSPCARSALTETRRKKIGRQMLRGIYGTLFRPKACTVHNAHSTVFREGQSSRSYKWGLTVKPYGKTTDKRFPHRATTVECDHAHSISVLHRDQGFT